MSRRTVIIQDLINHIAEHTQATGSRGMKFLHEINSFPSFYVHTTNERRVHKGVGFVQSIISIAIRGYDQAETLDSIELLVRNIETAIQTFPRNLVDECRTISVSTDEGLMSPYGIADLQIEILYTVEEGYNQPTTTVQYTLQDSTGRDLITTDDSLLDVPSEFK